MLQNPTCTFRNKNREDITFAAHFLENYGAAGNIKDMYQPMFVCPG